MNLIGNKFIYNNELLEVSLEVDDTVNLVYANDIKKSAGQLDLKTVFNLIKETRSSTIVKYKERMLVYANYDKTQTHLQIGIDFGSFPDDMDNFSLMEGKMPSKEKIKSLPNGPEKDLFEKISIYKNNYFLIVTDEWTEELENRKNKNIDENGYEFITNFWPWDPEVFQLDDDNNITTIEYEDLLRERDGYTDFIYKTPYDTDGNDLTSTDSKCIAIWAKK